MSTRSRIGLLYRGANGEKRVKSIYCHWDGYIEYNGNMLYKYYFTIGRLNQLLELGDISSLRKQIEPTTKEHTFDNPEEDITIAYHRDRGEDFHQKDQNLEDFIEDLKHSDIEFVYLRTDEQWLYATIDYDYLDEELKLSAFKPLKYKIEELKERGVIE